MKTYCENCKYFVTEVMDGRGKPLDFCGMCENKKHHKATTEADDLCPHYEMAKWAIEENVNLD